jgi:MFS family permease
MFSWGAITIATGGVKSYSSLMATRFLLGLFEAGLFPGLVYYLTFWYRSDERSLRVALIMASSTLAGAFGGAIAYGELQKLCYLNDMADWIRNLIHE